MTNTLLIVMRQTGASCSHFSVVYMNSFIDFLWVNTLSKLKQVLQIFLE